jgi:heme A synthase
MRPSRIIANVVGMMLFIQVILGGSSVLLNVSLVYHLVWGVITFIVLVVATVLAVRDYGSKSTLFKVSIVAIVDFVIQGILGALSITLNSDAVVVVHLTNAFVLAVLVTYMISFSDSADKLTRSTTTPSASTRMGSSNPK